MLMPQTAPAGATKQETWLPPGYFPPSNFVTDAFEKDEYIIFDKKLIKFSNFNLGGKRHFKRITSFDTHSTANLPIFF